MWRKVLLVLFSCGCAAPHSPGRGSPQPGLLGQAQAAIARDDWDDAAVLAARLLRENPNDPWAIQARYLLGAYYLKEHELGAAEGEFQYVASHATSPRLARQAQIRTGDVALAATNYDRAAALFSQLLQSAERHGDGAELTFRLGLVRQREGRWPDADALYDSVRTRYRDPVFAMRAAEQLAIPHHFSLQIGAYRSRANAEGKRTDLAGRGHEASVHEYRRHGTPFYCVRVGSFATRQKALDFRSSMTRDPDLSLSDVVP